MIDRYQFDERIAICMESGMPQRDAEETAAREFFGSCKLPTKSEIDEAAAMGWGKLKLFRTNNQEGLANWR